MVAVAEKGLAKKAMSEWTAHLAKSKLEPTMTVFQEFITQKAEELDEDDTFSKSSAPPKHNTPVSSRPYNPGRRTPRNSVLYARETSSGCEYCKDLSHVLYQCPDFRQLTVEQRQMTAQRLKVCNNCLGSDHITRSCLSKCSCRSCLSKCSCRSCRRRHYSLLHRADSEPNTAHYQQQPPAPPYQQSHPASQQRPAQQYSPQQAQLPRSPPTPASNHVSTTDTTCNTASGSIARTCVTTIESKGRQHKAKALLDNGSRLTFITSKMVSTLRMRRIPECATVWVSSKWRRHSVNPR